MLQPSVPELIEDPHNPVVEARTESLSSLRELGPPDLVYLVKQSSKSSTKQTGVYHHVTGVDASSSASLAAYINTLIYSSTDKNKVISGLVCCYNAFSRLDHRVAVTIPGSVEAYCIDERGEKKVATERLWLEAYLCGTLRAYSYSDNGSGDVIKKVVGCRRFNPITSTEAEHKWLDACEKLFFNGWQLGSDPEIQVPNLVSNHLTSGILRYIETTGRYTSGINLFEKLRSRDPEVSSLLAKVYLLADEQVKAVRLLHEAIEELPMDYALLDTQAHFCKLKGRSDFALDLARRSVISAPSEFCTWARLVEIYIGQENWELALLTLNSCPMFTYQDKDSPLSDVPARMNLPIMPETVCEEIDDPDHTNAEPVDPTLRRLVAGSFKGTFEIAYGLLTEITKKIGWDQLLKIRSQIFVMEEEYRSTHERQGSMQRNTSTVVANGNTSPPPTSPDGTDDDDDSGEEDAENEKSIASPDASTHVLNGTASPTLPKPSNTVDPSTAHAGSDNNSEPTTPSTPYTSFRHKRLCERWLDNLFMVLYEDLRIYTIWRTEVSQARAQQAPYQKSAEEFEILGALAQRLHYDKEAIEAFREALSQRFSPKAMAALANSWDKEEGKVQDVVGAVCRLVCWQYRWYSEFSPKLYSILRRLVESEGGLKISSLVRSTQLPAHVLALTENYTRVVAAFHSSGSRDGY